MTELWRLEEVDFLVKLAHEGVPLAIISMQLGRDIGDVEAKVAELGLKRQIAEGKAKQGGAGQPPSTDQTS